MKFWQTFARNLLVMLLIVGGFAIFMAIFYPSTLSIIYGVGQIYSGLNLWPFIILLLILAPSPAAVAAADSFTGSTLGASISHSH